MSVEKMYPYWTKQPKVLTAVIQERAALTKEFVRLFLDTAPDRLYLIGSGSSFNAAKAAAPFMEEILGIEAGAFTPTRLPGIFSKKPLVVFLSQGGSSTNMLAAADTLAHKPSIAVTGERECELAKHVKKHMLIGCGEELAGPKTMGYTASVMCLYLCALEAGRAAGRTANKKYSTVLDTLLQACENMPCNLMRTEEWFQEKLEQLKGIKKYVLVGTGYAAAAAAEGALKILETVRVPALAYEFEEYLHGPIFATDAGLGGVFFVSKEERKRLFTLAKCHAAYSGYTFVITSEEAALDARCLALRMTGAPYTEVFEFLPAPQLMAARLPEILEIPDGLAVFREFSKQWPTKFGHGR